MARLPALRDKTLISINTTINQTSVFAMVNTFTKGIEDAEKLASQYILGAIHNEVIDKFETIAKAAEAEKISAPKMSRSIKNKVIFNEDYYYVCP